MDDDDDTTSLVASTILASITATASSLASTPTDMPPLDSSNDPVPAHHANPVAAFIIGLVIVILASILNAAGLNLTKLDHVRHPIHYLFTVCIFTELPTPTLQVRTSEIPKVDRRKDWLRPLWLLGMVLYMYVCAYIHRLLRVSPLWSHVSVLLLTAYMRSLLPAVYRPLLTETCLLDKTASLSYSEVRLHLSICVQVMSISVIPRADTHHRVRSCALYASCRVCGTARIDFAHLQFYVRQVPYTHTSHR